MWPATSIPEGNSGVLGGTTFWLPRKSGVRKARDLIINMFTSPDFLACLSPLRVTLTIVLFSVNVDGTSWHMYSALLPGVRGLRRLWNNRIYLNYCNMSASTSATNNTNNNTHRRSTAGVIGKGISFVSVTVLSVLSLPLTNLGYYRMELKIT